MGADHDHGTGLARALFADSYGITHGTFEVEPDSHLECEDLQW